MFGMATNHKGISNNFLYEHRSTRYFDNISYILYKITNTILICWKIVINYKDQADILKNENVLVFIQNEQI